MFGRFHSDNAATSNPFHYRSAAQQSSTDAPVTAVPVAATVNPIPTPPATPAPASTTMPSDVAIDPSDNTMGDALAAAGSQPSFFEQKFAAITEEVPFNPAWSDGQGGFEPLRHDTYFNSFQLGEQFKTIDPQGRRLIIIATILGPVIIYQRKAKPHSSLGYHANDYFLMAGMLRFSPVKGPGQLAETEVESVLGSLDGSQFPNLGQRAYALMAELNRLYRPQPTATGAY